MTATRFGSFVMMLLIATGVLCALANATPVAHPDSVKPTVRLAGRTGARGAPPGRSRGLSGPHPRDYSGGDANVSFDLVLQPDGRLGYRMYGTAACAEGGSVNGVLGFGSGRWGGRTFSGSGHDNSLSGTLSDNGEHISGTYSTSVLYHIDLPPYVYHCKASGAFTGICGRAACPQFMADAGGPYDVKRAGKVTLDGYNSRGDIVSYRWQLRIADTDAGDKPGVGGVARARRDQARRSGPSPTSSCYVGPEADLKPFTARGPTVTIQALCDVEVMLTVKDKHGRMASDKTRINVTPRDWQTAPPIFDGCSGGEAKCRDRVSQHADPRPPAATLFDQPLASLGFWLEGQNECTDGRSTEALCMPCPEPLTRVVLPALGDDHLECPDSNTSALAGEWDPRRLQQSAVFKLGQIHTRGPFHNWYYATDSNIQVRRVGAINPFIEPGAPPVDPTGPPDAPGQRLPGGANNFYTANQKLGLDIAAHLKAVRAHEGYGEPASPDSGHEHLIEIGIITANPRAVIERAVGRTEHKLAEHDATCLNEINATVGTYAKDPLPLLPYLDEPVWTWDDAKAAWVSVTLPQRTSSAVHSFQLDSDCRPTG